MSYETAKEIKKTHLNQLEEKKKSQKSKDYEMSIENEQRVKIMNSQ